MSAKTSTTTLWKGSSVADAEINLASSLFTSAVDGDVLRVTFSFTTAGSMKLCYKSADDGWQEHAFDDINKNPYFSDKNVKSADFTINSTDLSTLKTYGMFVYGFESSTITKIELLHTLTPTFTGGNLLSENWVPTEESNKTFDALVGAKIGDVILVNVSCPAGWAWTEFYVRDKDGIDFSNVGHYGKSFETATDDTYEYEITNIADLKKIRANGFIVRAKVNCTITSIKLLSYEDSRDVVTITIPAVGYATWSSDKKYDFATADLKAYWASGVAEGSVTLTPMDITWDYQGYIIKGSVGEHDVIQSLTNDGSKYYPGDNKNYLKYNIDAAEVYDSGKNRYIFAMKNGDTSSFGFYKLTASHTLGAHKAYLETPTDITPAGARVALVFSDEAETTGISASLGEKVEKTSEHIYNLRGMRVTQPQKGLYIKNGKKMIIR